MSFQIIILAGGKGSRIKSVIGETPKLLALVKNKPFLDWLLLWIKSWDIEINKKIIISTCIGHTKISNYCKKMNYPTECINEISPLGTFGAIANVSSKYNSKNYIVINGDTIFKANFKKISNNYLSIKKKIPLILLKENINNSRYGGYKRSKNGWLFSLKKSKYISLGAFFISHEEIKERWINLTSKPFKNEIINQKTNEELMIDKDCFGNNPISAEILSSEIPFIDIGIPSDYNRAQILIPQIMQNI